MNRELNAGCFQFHPLDRGSIVSGLVVDKITQATQIVSWFQIALSGIFLRHVLFGKRLPDAKRCHAYY